MKRILLALLLTIGSAKADLVVIGHPKSGVEALNAKQVQDIYLGRTRAFPNLKFALPIDQANYRRAEFYELLTGRSLEQINAYWARIVFTGQASPPLQLPNDAAVLSTVRDNEGAIGYIDRASVDGSVRVLLLLRK